jgi:hypothetical protein
MATQRALLEIYGSLESAAARSGEPRVREVGEQLTPGASVDDGWYRELEAFMFPDGDPSQPDPDLRAPRTEPNPVRALRELNSSVRGGGETLTVPELSRLVYGIGALLRVNNSVPRGGPAPRWFDDTESDARTLLLDALDLAAPDAGTTGVRGFSDTRVRLEANLDSVVDLFSTELTSPKAFRGIAAQLAGDGLIDMRIADAPLEHATVVDVDGIKSLVIDTEFSSDLVSLNAMKAVIDPRNWHHNFPAFFCEMDGRGRRPDDWRRVVETVGVSAVPQSRRLRTHLKFYKSETNEPGRYEARLDYDLNDPCPDPLGDRQIDVDRGFINMRANGEPGVNGVVVRTRKVAHINGIRPETQSRFAFIFGYTAGAMEMLFGPATNPDPGFDYYSWTDEEDHSPSAMAASSRPASGAPAKPSSNSVASMAFRMAVEYAEDVSVMNLDLADRWLSGKLTLPELAEYSSRLTARLVTDPFKFLQAINRPKGGAA